MHFNKFINQLQGKRTQHTITLNDHGKKPKNPKNKEFLLLYFFRFLLLLCTLSSTNENSDVVLFGVGEKWQPTISCSYGDVSKYHWIDRERESESKMSEWDGNGTYDFVLFFVLQTDMKLQLLSNFYVSAKTNLFSVLFHFWPK